MKIVVVIVVNVAFVKKIGGPKKSMSKKLLAKINGSKKILGKKDLDPKSFGLKKILSEKLWSKRI